jgi:hypothetical protein
MIQVAVSIKVAQLGMHSLRRISQNFVSRQNYCWLFKDANNHARWDDIVTRRCNSRDSHKLGWQSRRSRNGCSTTLECCNTLLENILNKFRTRIYKQSSYVRRSSYECGVSNSGARSAAIIVLTTGTLGLTAHRYIRKPSNQTSLLHAVIG